MHYMADLIRDCSKTRSNTFNDLAFPINLQIEAKIRSKNISLRKKGRNRITERQKNIKNQDPKDDNPTYIKKQTAIYNKIERDQLNFLQVYQVVKPVRENSNLGMQLQLDKLDEKDEEATFQLYLLIKKRKEIFKVQEVRRKIRSKECSKRSNLKECDCCGKMGKHKCSHIICQKKCDKFVKKVQKTEVFVFQENQQPNSAVAIAQELIKVQNIEGPQIPIVQITIKEEQMVIPKIDVIQAQQAIKKQQQAQPELQAVVETERISEVQSKSQISQSKKNRSGMKELQFQNSQNIQLALKQQQPQVVEQIEQLKAQIPQNSYIQQIPLIPQIPQIPQVEKIAQMMQAEQVVQVEQRVQIKQEDQINVPIQAQNQQNQENEIKQENIDPANFEKMEFE